jgi:hypothetical protein
VRLLALRSSARIWAELHEQISRAPKEQAFRRLGGAPRVIVLNNLKEGVLRPDWYEPTLNPLYRDVLAHYGVTALPCRVGDPDRKGKVEAGVGHAQRTPLKGLHFETVQHADLEPARRGLGQATRRHAGGHRHARPPARTRLRRHLRAKELAHEGVRSLAPGGAISVNATRPCAARLAVLTRPRLAGFGVSTEAGRRIESRAFVPNPQRFPIWN